MDPVSSVAVQVSSQAVAVASVGIAVSLEFLELVHESDSDVKEVADVASRGVYEGVSLGDQVDGSDMGERLAGDNSDPEVSLTIQTSTLGESVAADMGIEEPSRGVLSVQVVAGCGGKLMV